MENMTRNNYKTRIKWKFLYTLSVISGLITLLTFFYPLYSDIWNRYVASRLISDYVYDIEEEQDYTEFIEAANQYNQTLFQEGPDRISTYTRRLSGDTSEDEQLSGEVLNPDSSYESQLNLFSNQMMGYLEIPAIHVSLPIYHYASEDVLSRGIGHLYGSSLPIGGMNTHTVLTGHSGLMNAKIFTDLNMLKTGDVFSIHVLNLVNDYQVDQIKIVLPNELEDLEIQKGKDLATLITCTPYGINTHRLLVRGHRIMEESSQKDQKETLEIRTDTVSFPYFMIGTVVFILIMCMVLLIRIWRKE